MKAKTTSYKYDAEHDATKPKRMIVLRLLTENGLETIHTHKVFFGKEDSIAYAETYKHISSVLFGWGWRAKFDIKEEVLDAFIK
jgi:hypothetical protein